MRKAVPLIAVGISVYLMAFMFGMRLAKYFDSGLKKEFVTTLKHP